MVATQLDSPGAALRGMTAKARKGELNLDASVFAILRRTTFSVFFSSTARLIPTAEAAQ